MTTKSITYKIQAFVPQHSWIKMSKHNRERTHDPIIEHNVPEEYIVTMDKLGSISTYTIQSYFNYRYFYISYAQYESIKSKIIWPTKIKSSNGYLGAIILRTTYNDKTFDILCWLNEEHNKNENITLYPCNYINSDFRNSSEMGALPNHPIKIFFTKDEYEVDKEKKKVDNNKKKEIKNTNESEIKIAAPIFSFKTPKFRILKIFKKTDWITDAKEGDIIYGEIPVIKINQHNEPKGCLFGGMSYSNFVNVYLNDMKVREISPLIFQDIFLKNYKVKEI